MRIGTAPVSWGVWFRDDRKQPPWTRFLDEAARAGYQWTELGPLGYLPSTANVLDAQLSKRGLALVGGVTMFALEDPNAWEDGLAETRTLCELLRSVGGEYLVIIDDMYTDLMTGRQKASPGVTTAEWAALVNSVQRLRSLAAEHGLTAVFHPHAESHVETAAQIERLLGDIDDLELCLDVGHCAYAGGDPIRFLKDHRESVAYLHLKNVDPEVLALARAERLPFAQAVARGVFVEPWLGQVDFAAFRDALKEGGYEGVAVAEQDMYPAEFDRPLPVAQGTREFLSSLGLE